MARVIPGSSLLRGFEVTIFDPVTGASETDSAWESCTGGAIGFDPGDGKVPLRYVDTVTLRGPLTAGRKAMCQWINDTVTGKPWKRTVTVKEILKDGSAGKSYSYLDCFPVRYAGPTLTADGTGYLYEEIEIKPIRIELP
jgi:hypothetical protein